jgi:KipI family sensor histidine kinase inhibitor
VTSSAASTPHATVARPRISHAGSSALLLDAGREQFSFSTQERLWALTAPDGHLRALPWVKDCVLGVNNLLITYDPLSMDHQDARAQLLRLWSDAPIEPGIGIAHEIPVDYDLTEGGDLAEIATQAGLDRDEVVRLHSSAEYRVACVGAMPGFAYLMGLPECLAAPRRASPRAAIPKGSVVIGAGQSGIMPCTAPSGWHVLGSTQLSVFDAQRPRPCLFSPGDRVVFKVREVCR